MLLVFIPIPNLSTNSTLFTELERTIQGAHIDDVGTYSLQIGDYKMYGFCCHYLSVISKMFSRNFPLKDILMSSSILATALYHIHKDSVTSGTQSIMALSLQVFWSHASANPRLWQSRYMWPATIRRYGIQHAVYGQINADGNGDQNFGGLLLIRYFCSRYG